MTWGGTEVPSGFFAAGENTNFRETRTTTGGRRLEHWPMYKCAPFGKLIPSIRSSLMRILTAFSK